MGEHPNVEATRTALEAFMKGDADTMMAGIADDAIWHVPGNNRFAGDFRGKDEIGARFQRMSEAGVMPTLQDIHDIVGNDEHVVALVQIGLMTPAGSASGRAVWVFHVRDGRAAEFWGYNEDQASFDALLGS
jgi:hypothetical protein